MPFTEAYCHRAEVYDWLLGLAASSSPSRETFVLLWEPCNEMAAYLMSISYFHLLYEVKILYSMLDFLKK